MSPDCSLNFERLKNETEVPVIPALQKQDLPAEIKETVVIDAIFGTGLSRKADGIYADAIGLINKSGSFVISVDLPSGLSSDGFLIEGSAVVRPSVTLAFEFPRLSFLLPDTGIFAEKWELLPIGLDSHAINEIPSDYFLSESDEIGRLVRKRSKFSHKGTYGHSLLIAGSEGKTGAAILAAGASLRSGTGLLTVHTPAVGYLPLNAAYPEAMISRDPDSSEISVLPQTEKFTAVGIGPGIGVSSKTERVVHALITDHKKPLVLDADALNILSGNKKWFRYLGEKTVLTPHPGEFDRLAGNSQSGAERLARLKEFASQNNCTVVLKGAYTAIAEPDGKVRFNDTGNNGMATGGCGDVLTGIILSLLSQGYKPADAARAGVWLHGKAGDIAAASSGFEALIASDIIVHIGDAFSFLTNMKEQ
jgi:NAD(P)H-hydrate epimerase